MRVQGAVHCYTIAAYWIYVASAFVVASSGPLKAAWFPLESIFALCVIFQSQMPRCRFQELHSANFLPAIAQFPATTPSPSPS